MTTNVNFTKDRVWAVESPLEFVEGSTVTLSCTYWSSVSSPAATVYRNKANVTSTVMPSGTATASGSVSTLKPLTALVGGAEYVVAVTGTVSGDVWIKKIEIICSKDEQAR